MSQLYIVLITCCCMSLVGLCCVKLALRHRSGFLEAFGGTLIFMGLVGVLAAPATDKPNVRTDCKPQTVAVLSADGTVVSLAGCVYEEPVE